MQQGGISQFSRAFADVQAAETGADIAVAAAAADDLARPVYGLLGIPVDAVSMPAVLAKIRTAAQTRSPFFISTPNVDFLVMSRNDPTFRETLLSSDLCPADGMPVVWMARLLGIPLRQRIAGSDVFHSLKSLRGSRERLSVFLFGGAEGVAAKAAERLNAGSPALTCAGHFFPGFCSVEEMSTEAIISAINASNADLLSVSLGARKGQAWLHENGHRLAIPVRAHLGATINFQAGIVRRAPKLLQRYGLEWMWRIKEEPHLWRRYLHDLGVLCELLLTRVVPLALAAVRHRLARRAELAVRRRETDAAVTVSLHGDATAPHIEAAARQFRRAIASGKRLTLDLDATSFIDQRFIGLLLMVRKQLGRRGAGLALANVPPPIARLFRLNGFGYLLPAQGPSCRLPE